MCSYISLIISSCADEWEDMCIVAVNDTMSSVFQDADFKKLLSLLHMQPPSDTVRCIYTILCM